MNTIIEIKKQVVYFRGKGYFFSQPKTKTSTRTITVDDYLFGELRRWKEQQIENEKRLGRSYIYRDKTTGGIIPTV